MSAERYLLVFSANLDGVRDELGCLLLGQTDHIFQQYGYLVIQRGRKNIKDLHIVAVR